MNEGPEDSKGFNFRPKIPIELVPGSVWRHANGELYFVDSIRNLYSENQNEYPTTVSYIRMADGTEWCKPVQGFLNKRVYVKQGAPVFLKEITPYSRWRRMEGYTVQVLGLHDVHWKEEGSATAKSTVYVLYLVEGTRVSAYSRMMEPDMFLKNFEKLPPVPRVRAPQS